MIELAGSRRGAWGRAAATLAAVLAVDQLSKALIRRSLAEGESDGILPGLELVHVRNPGVAFGIGSGGPLVVAATILAIVLLLAFFARNPRRRLAWLPTGLLAGGALGNLLDRLHDGAVTDFLKVPLWPAFNVSDIAITVGVLALLWVLEGPRREPAA